MSTYTHKRLHLSLCLLKMSPTVISGRVAGSPYGEPLPSSSGGLLCRAGDGGGAEPRLAVFVHGSLFYFLGRIPGEDRMADSCNPSALKSQGSRGQACASGDLPSRRRGFPRGAGELGGGDWVPPFLHTLQRGSSGVSARECPENLGDREVSLSETTRQASICPPVRLGSAWFGSRTRDFRLGLRSVT